MMERIHEHGREIAGFLLGKFACNAAIAPCDATLHGKRRCRDDPAIHGDVVLIEWNSPVLAPGWFMSF